MDAEARQFHCPNCNADLKFSPELQKFVCEFCKGEFTEAEALEYMRMQDEFASKYDQNYDQMPPEQDVTSEEQKERDQFSEETRLYSCPSCGAEIVSDQNTAASFCYYCHNPVILKGRVDGRYRPSRVLPFSFGREEAEKKFRAWAKTKMFAPKDLISNAQLEKLTGLYVPFWVANSSTSAHMEAIGENSRTWMSGNYRYTEVKRYRVVRDAVINYEGVPADGSQKIEDALMEAIEPYDYKEARPFSMAYLSGFLADKYDVDKEKVFPRIRSRMFGNNEQFLENSAKYGALKSKRHFSNIDSLSLDYMMLPVWFMTFEYKGKLWEYAVNGQTGKIAGELPISNKKLALACIIASAAIMLLSAIGGSIFS